MAGHCLELRVESLFHSAGQGCSGVALGDTSTLGASGELYHMRLGTHCTVVVTGHAVHGVHSVASLVLHAKRGIRCVGKAICSMAKNTLSGNCASRSCAVMKLSLPPLLFAPWLFVSCSHADARVLVTACAHDNACSRTHCFFGL